MRRIGVILFFVFIMFCVKANDNLLPLAYTKALQNYSIYFDTAVPNFYSGGLVGNGRLGASVYKHVGDTLCWELGCNDVVDHRGDNILYYKCRLPIGKILMPLNGHTSDMLMDIYNCEVSGKYGEVSWNTFTPATYDVMVMDRRGDNLSDLVFKPEISQSPRAIFSPNNKDMPTNYVPNPTPIIFKKGEYFICKQSLLAGGEYTTVWRTIESDKRKTTYLAIGYSQNKTNTEDDAIRDIEKVLDRGLGNVIKDHKKWWMNFYTKSFVATGDEKIDAFFWREMYKLGSVTRDGGKPIDLMGPWYHNVTPWPAIWWNLNIQLTYSPMFTINHPELLLPLCDMLDNNIENLKLNVPKGFKDAAAIGRSSSYDCLRSVGDEHGLLTWTLFYYWKYCKYTDDTPRLKEKLFPLLKLAVNYYRYLLFEGEDDNLHMPESFSPEYKSAEDCNFELAILRWGLKALIDTDEKYSINDPLLTEWKRIMSKLTPYPVGENGFMIGKGVELESGHRHYSHLLMLYPLDNFPTDTPENEELARKSILHWLNFQQKGYYTGYTYTGASSMYTILGDGELAYKNLRVMLDRYLQPNNLYKESGPVIETPLSGLASLTEMLLSSKDSMINVFAAIPTHWKDVKYEKLRAEGGFEVDAKKENGITTLIRIRSIHGNHCVVKCDIPSDKLEVENSNYCVDGKGLIHVWVPDNEVVLLRRVL